MKYTRHCTAVEASFPYVFRGSVGEHFFKGTVLVLNAIKVQYEIKAYLLIYDASISYCKLYNKHQSISGNVTHS